MTPHRLVFACALFASVSIATVPRAAGPDGGERFFETGRLAVGAAEWLSLDGDRLAFGSGVTLHLAEGGPAPVLRSRVDLERAVDSAVLVRGRLYVASPARGLAVLDLDGPSRALLPVPLEPAAAGALQLGRMDDYLLVAEDGFGLRVLDMAFHAAHHGTRPSLAHVEQTGALHLDGEFRAVTSSLRHVYLATADGTLLVVDATDPRRPLLLREVGPGLDARDLAANGDTVYALGSDRLRILDLSGTEVRVLFEVPLHGPRALALAGRTLHVAAGDGGLLTLRDGAATAGVVSVSVGDNFFSPSSVTINAGDFVRWTKQTFGFHNVESCDGAFDPAGCQGNVSPDGSWESGAPTTAQFVYEHEFVNTGLHRYFCVVHGDFGMVGSVRVNAFAPTPPGVPDGTNGAPLRVGKLDAAGNLLSVSWDTATCTGAADHHLVFGGGSQLPTVLGENFGVAGGRCDVGTTSPLSWDSPSTTIDPTGLVWFLMLADDNASTEGSWGKDVLGNERVGPGPGGSSGQCGITAKNLFNACGQ